MKTADEIYKTASVSENFRFFNVSPCSLKYNLTALVSVSSFYLALMVREVKDIEFCSS